MSDVENIQDGKIPLGLCKQAYMKLESAMNDIQEIKEDEDIEAEDKETFNKMAETLGLMMAHIINIVSKEMGEEEFLNETIDMDQIDEYPDPDPMSEDIMDMEIE